MDADAACSGRERPVSLSFSVLILQLRWTATPHRPFITLPNATVSRFVVFSMSLYHEAAQVLESIRKNGGSIKSNVFVKKTWKSDPKALFALTTEASKWSEILSEVIEHSGILKAEKQVSLLKIYRLNCGLNLCPALL